MIKFKSLFRRQTPHSGAQSSRKAPHQLRGAGSISSLDSKHRGGTGMVDLAAELERLTREKLALEARVSELTMYQSEAAALRSEVHKLQEERLEMDRLHDVAHSPLSDSEKEQLLARQHGNTMADLPDTSCSTPDWDKQSSSSLSEVSVACLQDRIMQMEETHYSTNEELQATLQELADLQVQLTELQTDNERLADEKSVLLESLCRQTEKLEDSRSKVDTLQELLLHRDQGESCTEREQKLVELLKGAQEEREALLLKQEELTSQLNDVRQTADLQGQEATRLADRVRLLESTVDATHAERKQLDQELALAKEESSSRSIEISRLTTLLDNARAKIEELEQAREVGDKTELDELLDNARKEKDTLESQVATLQEQLSRSQCEVTRLRDQLSHIQEECKVVRNNAKSAVSDLEYQCSMVRQEKQQLAADLQVLQESVSELQVQCQCHLEDKRQLKAVLSETQRHLSEVERRLAEQEEALAEEKRLRQEENSEWDQFQSDLLMTVRVANDFKTEAQQELEKLVLENKTLRDKLRSVEAQLEKLKAQYLATRNSVALQRKRPFVSMRPIFSKGRKCMKNSNSTPKLSSYDSDSNLLLISRNNLKTKSETGNEVMLSSLPNLLNATNEGTESQKSLDKVDGMTETEQGSELYDIHWDFPTLRKRSWSHIAKFALDLPSQGDERPASSPAALPSQKHSVPVSPAVPVVPTETSTLLDMAAVRRQHKVGVSRQDSRLSVKSLIESIENATKQAKAGPGSRSSSTSSLSSIASGAPPTPTSPRRRLASETPLRDQQQTTNTTSNKIQPLRKNTLSDKPSSQDEEVPAPNPVSILANKTMDFVRRNSYGDLSERKDPLSGLVKNGGSKRNALLKWCQNKTIGYRNIDITNFSSSWNDGLALCAILHSYLPERVPYDSLTQSEKRRNFTIAFAAAESVGIPTTLNVTDMIQLERPDWQQVMAYVTAIYKHFET